MGVCCTAREGSAFPPLQRPSSLNFYSSIMTARWRGTMGWRGTRRYWRRTTLGPDLLRRSPDTSGAVISVRATRWCGMLPTVYCPLFLSLLGLGAVCPLTRLPTCLPATTMMLSSWLWTASLKQPISFLPPNQWRLRTWPPFFFSTWFGLTVSLTRW